MSDHNTKDKGTYLFENIFYSLIAMIWYRNILFRCVGNLSFSASKALLWTMLISGLLFGMFLGFKKRRNGVSLFANIAFPYGLYTVIAYMPVKTKLITIILCAAAVLALIYAVLVLGRRINNRNKYMRVMKNRIVMVLGGAQVIFAVGTMLIMVPFAYNIFRGSAIMQASTDAVRGTSAYGQKIADNMDTLLQMQEDTWQELTVQERLEVMQTVANIEACYLGIPHEYNVGAANMNDGCLGYYRDATHEIVISLDCLLNAPAAEVLEVVCHEAYHGFEHRTVDVYESVSEEAGKLSLFYEASVYAEEFRDYQDGEDSYCAYYDQLCERNAREYAEVAVYDYCDKIAAYLNDAQ